MNATGTNTRPSTGLGKPRVAQTPDTHRSIPNPSQSVAVLLGTIPTLRFVTPAGLKTLAATTRRETIEAGRAIIQQRDVSDDVFFILEGTFDVMISHFGDDPGFVRTLRAGDSFGELGVLYDVPRTATVRCTATAHVLRIPGEAFLEALETWS